MMVKLWNRSCRQRGIWQRSAVLSIPLLSRRAFVACERVKPVTWRW